MSSAGTRERELPVSIAVPGRAHFPNGKYAFTGPTTSVPLASGKQITVSTSNVFDRSSGHYISGGAFYTSRVTPFFNPGGVANAATTDAGEVVTYSGPVVGVLPSTLEMETIGYGNIKGNYGSKNESQLSSLGTTAISLSSPTNPASDLGTTLAESVREGIPSLPGIKLWKGRTAIAKAAGSEYLNAEFGWLPLVDEVKSVRDAAVHHRDIMQHYHEGEGSNTHRSFSFPSERSEQSYVSGQAYPEAIWPAHSYAVFETVAPQRTISLVRETKRWFEGCYTYGLPSSTDSWKRAMGFGSDADQLFGIAFTPDVLWELTPWSWAVDWFSNAGQVINNVTNFGLAGLVLRYGYIMEESIERVTASYDGFVVRSLEQTTSSNPFPNYGTTRVGPSSCGIEFVTKRRAPASPFGFSVGWEGLSPTQLAITAALGITRLL
jgi:hypothetical protein